MLKRLKAITKSYFKGANENMHWSIRPFAWLWSPLCIVAGYLILPDWMMNVKESDYKGK